MALEKITDEQKLRIKQNTASVLPDNPSNFSRGNSQALKDMLGYKAIMVLVEFINGYIDEINSSLSTKDETQESILNAKTELNNKVDTKFTELDETDLSLQSQVNDVVDDLEAEVNARNVHDSLQDLHISENSKLVSEVSLKATETLIKINSHLDESKGMLLKNINHTYNTVDGVLSLMFTFSDDTTKTLNIDLPTENTVSGASMDGNYLVISFVGGTETRVDLSKLIGDALHNDSDTIHFIIGSNHSVQAEVKKKSLDATYFTNEFLNDMNVLNQSMAKELERQTAEKQRNSNESVRMTQEEARQKGFAEMSEKFSGFEGAIRLTKSEYEALAEKEDKFYFVIED